MARMNNTNTVIASSDTTLTTSTVITLAQAVDIREALSGALHIKFKCSTGPGTGKTLSVYGLFSQDNSTFDSGEIALANLLGSFSLPNDTSDHYITIPLDGVILSANYMKVALYCDAASNYGVLRTMNMSVRKAV